MKAFCMSVHVSVIQDLKTAYPDLEVVDWCMSGASWVMGRPMDVPDIINHRTWKQMTPEMIAEFQAKYDGFLRQFDMFIVAHPSVFAMVFEKYGKPILVMNTTRYDMPFCFTGDLVGLARYRACLQRLSQAGRLHIVSNNRADQIYLQKGCGLDSALIPSLCLYTKVRYAPSRPEFVVYHGSLPDHPLLAKRPRGHSWGEITAFRGLISIPYEISLMSLFEYFTAGVPFFFPSKTYWKANYKLESMECYWDNRAPPELAEFQDMTWWIEMSDLYSVLQSPNTYYFDSYEHLLHLLETFEYKDDRAFREEHKSRILLEWKRVFQRIQSDAFWTKPPRHICYNRLPLLANVVFDINYAGTGVVPQHTYPNRIPLAAGDVVFVKTEGLPWLFQKHSVNVPITLVTGVSDISPSADMCKRICNNPFIKRWIGCNIPVTHPKIVKLPIGVGEPERPNGDHETLLRLYGERVAWEDKEPDVCVPYHGETHASRTSVPTLPKLPFEDYMREISRHRFVVCQRGNGLDTHRVCEVLLMGSIPVLEHSALDDMYGQWNCLLVDSLESFDTSSVAWDPAKDEAFLDVFWLRDGLRDKLLTP